MANQSVSKPASPIQSVPFHTVRCELVEDLTRLMMSYRSVPDAAALLREIGFLEGIAMRVRMHLAPARPKSDDEPTRVMDADYVSRLLKSAGERLDKIRDECERDRVG